MVWGQRIWAITFAGAALILVPSRAGHTVPAPWFFAIVLEVVYVYLIVFCFRAIQLHRLCSRLGKGLAAFFSAKAEP
jgi:hypothetical protein